MEGHRSAVGKARAPQFRREAHFIQGMAGFMDNRKNAGEQVAGKITGGNPNIVRAEGGGKGMGADIQSAAPAVKTYIIHKFLVKSGLPLNGECLFQKRRVRRGAALDFFQ